MLYAYLNVEFQNNTTLVRILICQPFPKASVRVPFNQQWLAIKRIPYFVKGNIPSVVLCREMKRSNLVLKNYIFPS